MKKLLLILTASLLLSSAFAQTSDKKWGLGLGLGGYNNLDNSSIGFMPELYLSRYLSPKFDLTLKGEMGLFNSKLINDLDLFNTSLNLRYKFTDESKKFRPYVYAGPGYLADNSTSGLNFDLGLGAKYYIGQATALYLEAGYINGIDATTAGKSVKDNFMKATLGVEFDFGKAKDSDMDGVPDKKDKCPNTPAGVAVDTNGCPIDTDGDGVADYIDECPTVAGLTSLKGCPDSDKDGVADKDDACPDVPGLVNLKGCPDSDGDGIADKDDKCPNTPKGYKVDAKGCPFDRDNDGVVDEEDHCPTEAGPKENHGCPVKDTKVEESKVGEIKVDPIYFDSSKSDFAPTEKAKINKLINLLKGNSNYNVKVNGYTDSKGDDNYNLNLSNSRANSVTKQIVSGKIEKKRITQKGFGEANPAATNDTEEGRALNRRVEFELIKTK
jgi:outer membrane protein OmpA-like peptidoglycan-associated protein